jgi:hypothetical protein
VSTTLVIAPPLRHCERERGNPGFIAARLEPWREISQLLRISSGGIKTWVATLALAMTKGGKSQAARAFSNEAARFMGLANSLIIKAFKKYPNP